MKLLLPVLLLTVACSIFGQASGKSNRQNRAERELRAIEETRRAAIKNGDMRTLDRIYARDFSAIAGSGQIIGKQQLLAIFQRNDPRVTFTTDEISVRVFGKSAVFVGRLIGKTAAGQTISDSRFTHYFVRRNGRWQCVAGQSTPLPAATNSNRN
jgi:ketosteroid isomerase-like protein